MIITLQTADVKVTDQKEEGGGDEKVNTDNNVYHLNQFVSNACGTIALIHSIANKLDK